MVRKDKTRWGYQSVDAIVFGTDLVKVLYQDPSDLSINWLDFNKKINKVVAYGTVLGANKAVLRSPVVAVSWISPDNLHQRIRVFYVDEDYILQEINFDDGKNPQAGPLGAKKLKLHKFGSMTAACFWRDDIGNIRLYFVNFKKQLREYNWGVGGRKEWTQGQLVRERVQVEAHTRLVCINLRKWSNTTPDMRIFGLDWFEKLYEHMWNGSWGSEYRKPKDIFFFVKDGASAIMERFRIGDSWEAGKQQINLDRIYPFTIVNDPLDGEPDHMHMFMSNGRNFYYFIRNKGTWSEHALPQTEVVEDLTDVQSIKKAIDGVKK
ncbi:hypothetical protein ABW20_dc0104932 [Dactylellina cionopaga]|nr:hypothetical protein ABW20_dc0104932 [Dactylellina cionopaga]